MLLASTIGVAGFGFADDGLAISATSASVPRSAPLPPKRPDIPQRRSDDRRAQEPKSRAAATSSACVALLHKHGAEFDVMPPQAGADACKIDEPVAWRGVKAHGGISISLDAAVTVRCALAVQLTLWVRDDLAPITERFGYRLRRLVGVGGQECRARNRQSGARISEHATGNAFDVRKLEAEDGTLIDIVKNGGSARRPLRDEIRASACARFTTVLGSGSDGFHEDHLHVDLRVRRGGRRLCQWDVH